MSDLPDGRIGVVLMAYGTPGDTAAIQEYYTDIRRGHPPTDEALAELTARYDAIGGVSPLARHTEEQRVAVQAALDGLEPGRYTVVLGLKHAAPKIEAAVDALAEQGVERIVGAVLAPHFSEFSVGQYLGRMGAAAERYGIASTGVESWAREPALIEFTATDLRHRLDAMGGRTKVLFTAHSLPERILEAGDPYPSELRATAEAVADVLHLTEGHDWQIAWQSAGRTADAWLGPDILEVIDDLGAGDSASDANGTTYEGVIVSALGFVADHLEVLYDLDIEARGCAEQYGLRFDRTRCINDDPAVMGALARRIDETATAAFAE